MPKGIPTEETARQYKQRKRDELRAVWRAWRKFNSDNDVGPSDASDLPGTGFRIGIEDNLQELRSLCSDKRWGR
jgi:hypothetical protein